MTRANWLTNRWVAVGVAFAGPLLAAAIMTSFRSQVANTRLALVMVAVVVAAVSPGRRGASLVAGVSAGLWFDFFLTRPYESFTIGRSADLQTTLLLVAVAVAVGEMATRRRQHRDIEVAARADVAGISRVAEMLAAHVDPDVVVDRVAEELAGLLSLVSVRYDADGRRAAPYVDRAGAVRYNSFVRDTAVDGLPNADVTLMVEAAGISFGRYVLRGPELGVPLAPERLVAAVALVDLVAVALSRWDRVVPPAPVP